VYYFANKYNLKMMQIFDINKEYILENDVVLLRPLAATDYEHLLPFAINEPDTWKFSLVSASGAEGMRNYIDTAIVQRAKGIEYAFIVFDKRTQAYAGSTRFYDIQLHNQSLQLGYTWYGSNFQGTGLNKNCKLLLLQFAFEELGMERVEFRASNENERSKAAMRSIGCVEEGMLRSHMATFTGARRNSIILSILKDEWNGGVKRKLEEKMKGL
jgi:N-acetyltransferase